MSDHTWQAMGVTHGKPCVHLHVFTRHMASHVSTFMEGASSINRSQTIRRRGGREQERKREREERREKERRKGKKKEEKEKEERERKEENEGVSHNEQTRTTKNPELPYKM